MAMTPEVPMTSLMHGKRGLIMGVANERSIAWGIAKTLHAHGAELAFTYRSPPASTPRWCCPAT
jgi:enoyl-[acyl-carrier-protein] reductase (NADH)